MLTVGTITGIALVGIASTTGKLLFEKYDRHDLAKTLTYSVTFGGVLFVAYKVLEYVHAVTTMFFL